MLREISRTAPIGDTIHQLVGNEVRDPLERQFYIDTDESQAGEDFCRIVIGGCLWAVEQNPTNQLPDCIREFLSDQDGFYSALAKQTFFRFWEGNLILKSEKQMAILKEFGSPRKREEPSSATALPATKIPCLEEGEGEEDEDNLFTML